VVFRAKGPNEPIVIRGEVLRLPQKAAIPTGLIFATHLQEIPHYVVLVCFESFLECSTPPS
jgi:hypothetical protein